MKIVNEYVKLLKASGLTQKALAKEMGVSERTYSKWVHGAATPKNSKSKAAMALALAKYGSKRRPRALTPAEAESADAAADKIIGDVPDFDPLQLKLARKASGLTVKAFMERLGITTQSQYYRYEGGYQARKRTLRKVLYDVCQGHAVEPAPEGETNPQARTRGRSVISEDRIKERVERFERTELLEHEREYVRRALRFTAQEQGMVPRELREAMVTVLATLQGRIPLNSLSALLMGTDP